MASRLDLATRLAGEGDILAAVAANPADDTAKLVYADWLDEHDDPRGTFLRQFVDAARNGRVLPEAAAYPASWLELVGVPLVALVRSLGLDEHRTAILARAKPAVAINTEPCAENELPVDGSKFGGLPALPRGAAWPQCERAPLEFLAQFDLAELSRTVAGRALPAAGLLSFFMYHNYSQDEFGGPEGRGPADGLQIIHTPPGVELRLLDPPQDLVDDDDLGPPRRPCRLVLADALDMPDDNESESWAAFDERQCCALINEASHQLFGYSHVTVLAEDPTPGPDWELLIGFCADDNLNWGWGDGHRLFWYVPTADLRARQFDGTVAIDG